MNKKKLIRIVIGALLLIAIGVITVLAFDYNNHKPLKDVNVHINDDDFHNFLQKTDIKNILLQDRNLQITDLSRSNIDLEGMERIITANPWVKSADLYISNDDILQVMVEQRIPVARIFTKQGASYYIDENLQIMPPAVGYSYPAVVFTNVKDVKNMSEAPEQQKAIAKLATFILNDTFWRHQITQVNLASDKDFELYTLIGDQKIIFGDTNRIADKFENLFVFYKQVSNQLGWDKYTELDLRFGQQVVARPSLGWVAPKAKDTMVAMPDEIKNINEIISSLPEKSVFEEENVQLPKPDKDSKSAVVKPKNTNSEKTTEKVNIASDSTKSQSKNEEKEATKIEETKTIKKEEKKDEKKEEPKKTMSVNSSNDANKKSQKEDDKKTQPKYKYPG